MKMALLSAMAIGVAVAGCAPALKYEPFTVQEMESTQALRVRFENLRDEELVYEVIAVTNYRCDMFFEALDEVHSRLDFYQRIINSLTTGLPPVLTAASINGQAVANVAAALGFATSTLKNANELLLLAEFKPALFSRWEEARDKQRGELEKWLDARKTRIRAELKLHLYEYARICLPTQLKSWLHESARLGKLVTSGTGTPPPLNAIAGARPFGMNEGAGSPRPRGPRPLVVR